VDAVATRLLDWWDVHGRKDLPWQRDRTSYRVWVSEIMLQQTQVTTVIPYYEQFVARFPDVDTLARAALDEVLHHWTGLGYYARARNLHKAANVMVTTYEGEFPLGVEALSKLPGIGRSTAGAIASLAQGIRAPILDGNVKRVLARHHAVAGYPGDAAVAGELWVHAEAHTPAARFADYTQAIMDLGATVCRRSRPDCGLCPLRRSCRAHATGRVEDYPGRKPRRDKPVRQSRMFLLQRSDGAVLLERRPPVGVWGGLWTPPERPPETTAGELAEELGLDPARAGDERVAPRFRHTFTHFHLDIEPVYLTLHGEPAIVADADGWCWHRADGNAALGLSAPAVKLLRSLTEFALT